MLPLLEPAILLLEEGFVLLGEASIVTDAVVVTNALRVGRFLPSTIRASKGASRLWSLATKVANATDKTMSSRAYSDLRAMTHELSKIYEEYHAMEKNIDSSITEHYKNPRKEGGLMAANPRDSVVRLSYTTSSYSDGSVVSGEEVSVPLIPADELISSPYIAKRMVATYLGKRFISKLSKGALAKFESLNLIEGYIARQMAKQLIIEPAKFRAQTEFDNLARSWASENFPGVNVSKPIARMFIATGYVPIGYKAGDPRTIDTNLTLADYQNFSFLILNSTLNSVRSFKAIASSSLDSNLINVKQVINYRS